MKITIAYLPNEEHEADAIKRAICCTLGKVKVKENDRHTPFKHIYITARKPKTDCNAKGNT